MKRNKYDKLGKIARQIQGTILESPWRIKITYNKPVWDGRYRTKWIINPKHETHPLAEVAESLLYLCPTTVINPRYQKPDFWVGECTITEAQYLQLDARQKKFFTDNDLWQYERYLSVKPQKFVDRFGHPYYKMKSWYRHYFYTVILVKNKIKHEWIRSEEPGIRKLEEKLYHTGFGHRYLFRKHKPRKAERMINEKGKNRRNSKELEYLIQEGLSEYYEEIKNG